MLLWSAPCCSSAGVGFIIQVSSEPARDAPSNERPPSPVATVEQIMNGIVVRMRRMVYRRGRHGRRRVRNQGHRASAKGIGTPWPTVRRRSSNPRVPPLEIARPQPLWTTAELSGATFMNTPRSEPLKNGDVDDMSEMSGGNLNTTCDTCHERSSVSAQSNGGGDGCRCRFHRAHRRSEAAIDTGTTGEDAAASAGAPRGRAVRAADVPRGQAHGHRLRPSGFPGGRHLLSLQAEGRPAVREPVHDWAQLDALVGVLGGVQANPYIIDAIIGFSVVYKAFDNMDGFKRFFGVQPGRVWRS